MPKTCFRIAEGFGKRSVSAEHLFPPVFIFIYRLICVMQFSHVPASALLFGTAMQRVLLLSLPRFKMLLKCCLGYSALLWAVVMLFPRQTAMLFAGDAAFLDYTAWALRIYMAAELLMGIQIACQQTFIRDGFRKEHRHILLFHKMRQNINQWYQQQYFTVKYASPRENDTSLHTAWAQPVRHAVYGKRAECLLQFLPAEIWRGYGRRRDDDTWQPDAVFHAPAFRAFPGRAAHHRV